MTQYARSKHDWEGVTLPDEERAAWVRGRLDLENMWRSGGPEALLIFVQENRDRVDAVIVGDVAPWGERGKLQRNEMGLPVVIMATDGACGRSWNDALITSMTPVPAGRCPFEYDHEDEDEDEDAEEDEDDGYSWSDASALYQLAHGTPGEPRTDSARAYLESRLAE